MHNNFKDSTLKSIRLLMDRYSDVWGYSAGALIF